MTTFSVPDMSCGHCKASVERAVKGVDATASLTFDMTQRQVEIASRADNALLQTALKNAGFDAIVM